MSIIPSIVYFSITGPNGKVTEKPVEPPAEIQDCANTPYPDCEGEIHTVTLVQRRIFKKNLVAKIRMCRKHVTEWQRAFI